VVNSIRKLIHPRLKFDRVSVGFPGVVVDGVVHTAVNLHPDWIGFDLARTLRLLLGKPVRAANDADIQGYGVIEGSGVELVLTLGTGLGTALFVNGHLVPNLELGHHPFRKQQTYEEQVGRAALDAVGKRRWNRRVRQMLDLLGRIINYRMVYLGGGNAKKLEGPLPENARVVSNEAGLLGGITLWRDK
jgi:polyphosphate glucokinase